MLSLTDTDMVRATGDGLDGAGLLALARERSKDRRAKHRVAPSFPDPTPKRLLPIKRQETRAKPNDYWAGYSAGFRKQALAAQQSERNLKAALAVADLERRRAQAAMERVREVEAAVSFGERIGEPTMARILSRVMWLTGVSKLEIKSLRRDKRIAMAKTLFYHLAHEHTSQSLPQMSKFMGLRDHTTALYHIRAWQGKKAKARSGRGLAW